MSGMAGRPLRDDEVVGHVNGDVTDCSPDNLALYVDGECLGKPVHWLVANARWVMAMYGGREVWRSG
jgi:hypothetical protein